MSGHLETIICPNCEAKQQAEVQHTRPFWTYINECECGYTIQESEWEKEVKTLLLTLKKEAFEVMKTSEKKQEFRKPSQWIKSRLMEKDGTPKHYDEVLFVNGYGKDKPRFRAKYKGFYLCDAFVTKTYSNGLKVEVEEGFYVIELGEVVSTEGRPE